MANQITGRIREIGNTVHIPSKNGGNPFYKREILLDATTYDPYTGELSQNENIVPLEFSGDKCSELERYRPGDLVIISFALQGRSWTTQDGQTKRMVSIRCYKIERRNQPGQTAPTQQAAPPQPTPQYQAPTQRFPPNVDAYGNPQTKDDLPF